MRAAVYAGTFDPVTAGHLSVIERAAGLFDRLIVVVAVNPAKEPLFSPDERVALLRDVTRDLPNVECEQTPDLVVEVARRRGARYLVRGLRGVSDAEYETALAMANRSLAPEISTVFVPADAALAELSSTGLKVLASRGADLTGLCPPVVAERLRERLSSRRKPSHVQP